MPRQLPSFEEMAELARERPEAFERLRADVCESFINDAPESFQRRLRGLQFRIDMERRRSANPMAACVRISQMMHASFEELRRILNGEQALPETGVEATRDRAPVVPIGARGRWTPGGDQRPG